MPALAITAVTVNASELSGNPVPKEIENVQANRRHRGHTDEHNEAGEHRILQEILRIVFIRQSGSDR
jgi:hypothetical protein